MPGSVRPRGCFGGRCGLGRGGCGDRAGVHARAGHPAGRRLVDPRHRGGGAGPAGARGAGPGHVRRAGRAAGWPAVGPGCRRHPRPEPARAVHQPGRVPPAAAGDPDLRRAVPGGGLADQPARPAHAGWLRRLAALAGLAAATHGRRGTRRAGPRHDLGGLAGRTAVPDPGHPVPRRGGGGPAAGGGSVRGRPAGRFGVRPGRGAAGRAGLPGRSGLRGTAGQPDRRGGRCADAGWPCCSRGGRRCGAGSGWRCARRRGGCPRRAPCWWPPWWSHS